MLPRLKAFLCALALLSFFTLHAGALPGPTTSLQLRQDGANPQPSTTNRDPPASTTQQLSTQTPGTSPVPESSTSAQRTQTSDSRDTSSSETSVISTTQSRSAVSSTPSPTGPVSTVSTSAEPTATSPAKDSGNPLPVQPVITPALGIAGVIFILFGAALAFVGVRSKWLFIFESTAFLVALAIVVLLVYVASPPVSDAIQGAYFVAAFVPACIIGGVSLVFRDLVEGLGCLLGGFCLSMWFMVLKNGGLISSSGGRIGFIVALSVAGFALSFSHYTREYGLIACLSFAGATSLILGVDCFSRAGLKEFWIYVWNLNDSIFPLGTTTYPLTRGIKVEIACIIILSVFGAMSQMKLWKIIREKRAKRAAARAQDDEDREHLESNLGRQLQIRNNKELAQWEATYGDSADPSAFTTTFGSMNNSAYHSYNPSLKGVSISAKDSPKESVEMTDMSPTAPGKPSQPQESEVTIVPVAAEFQFGLSEPTAPKQSNSEAMRALDTVRELDSPASSRLRALETVREQDSPASSRPTSYVVQSDEDEGHWESKHPQGPAVTPLPFQVPSKIEASAAEDDAQSTCTAGNDVQDLDETKSAQTVRQSNSRPMRIRVSNAGPAKEAFDYVLSVPHEDDARSSVAATLDGLSEDDHDDLPALSRSGTPLPAVEQVTEDEKPALRRAHSASSLKDNTSRSDFLIPSIDEDKRRHSVQLGKLLPDSNLGSLSNLPEPRGSPEKSLDVLRSPQRRSDESTVRERAASQPVALTKDVLPGGQSNTVLLYRTNEWAKHQAVAESVHPDEIAPPSEGGVSVAYGAETSAPVDIAALSQTAFTPSPPSVSRESSKIASNNPYRKHSQKKPRSSSDSQHPMRNNSTPALVISRNPSQTSLHRANMARSPSNPALSPASPYGAPTIIESPIDEALPALTSPSRTQLSPVDMPSTNTLMGRRQSMINGRMSSMSFASPDAPTHSTAGLEQITEQPLGPSDSASSLGQVSGRGSVVARRRTLASEEDMTLAQRKVALQQQGKVQRSPSALASANPYRTRTTPSPSMQRSMSQQYAPSSAAPSPSMQRSMSQQSIAPSAAPSPSIQRSLSQQYASPTAQLSASNSRFIYDSHQPKRGASVNEATREHRLASWRASMAQDAAVIGRAEASKTSLIDDSRTRIIEEQRRAGEMRALKEQEARKRSSQIDVRMRSGDMVALHREHMRKLQRQASQTQ